MIDAPCAVSRIPATSVPLMLRMVLPTICRSRSNVDVDARVPYVGDHVAAHVRVRIRLAAVAGGGTQVDPAAGVGDEIVDHEYPQRFAVGDARRAEIDAGAADVLHRVVGDGDVMPAETLDPLLRRRPGRTSIHPIVGDLHVLALEVPDHVVVEAGRSENLHALDQTVRRHPAVVDLVFAGHGARRQECDPVGVAAAGGVVDGQVGDRCVVGPHRGDAGGDECVFDGRRLQPGRSADDGCAPSRAAQMNVRSQQQRLARVVDRRLQLHGSAAGGRHGVDQFLQHHVIASGATGGTRLRLGTAGNGQHGSQKNDLFQGRHPHEVSLGGSVPRHQFDCATDGYVTKPPSA